MTSSMARTSLARSIASANRAAAAVKGAGHLQNPQALDTHQKAEIAKWWPLIKAAEIKVE